MSPLGVRGILSLLVTLMAMGQEDEDEEEDEVEVAGVEWTLSHHPPLVARWLLSCSLRRGRLETRRR